MSAWTSTHPGRPRCRGGLWGGSSATRLWLLNLVPLVAFLLWALVDPLFDASVQIDRGGLAEVVEEAGRLGDQLAIECAGRAGEFAERRLPAGQPVAVFFFRRRQTLRGDDRRGELFQIPHGHGGARVFERDDFSLFGDTNPAAVDRGGFGPQRLEDFIGIVGPLAKPPQMVQHAGGGCGRVLRTG